LCVVVVDEVVYGFVFVGDYGLFGWDVEYFFGVFDVYCVG